MAVTLAHIADFATTSPVRFVVFLGVAAACAVLALEHTWVKHGRLGLRQLRPLVATFAAIALAATVAPVPGFAQSSSEPQGLPDLISDPPSPERTRLVRTPAGDVIRVLTFDGFIHNIGTGKLEVSGNPQVEGGMQQRVFDGTEWNTVGTPTVRFETDDGHNHFHLIRAIDYALWSDDRTEQVTDASKVGFCLVDTVQVEEGFDSNYLISDYNYCGVDDPESTDLVMGITPGWRDTYDANVTMQWVDISNTRPGIYWVSAITDPNNEIVESNEDNNDIVFSSNSMAVDGYVARELEVQRADTAIRLKATTFGTVGQRAFVIAEGPVHGSLDVPVGMDLVDIDTVRYVPEAGFSGSDTFTYYAHDVSSPFPHDPVMMQVLIEVDEAASPPSTSSADVAELAVVNTGSQQAKLYEQVELGFELQDAADAANPVAWYARDLPSGLAIDATSGVVSGVPAFADEFDSTIGAWIDGTLVEQTVQWTIADNEPPSLAVLNSFSTSSSELLRLPIGAGREGATYRGVGLPEGGVIVPNQPMVTGVGREVGTFAVTVEEVIDDEVVGSVDFEWTVRPSIRPAFPL